MRRIRKTGKQETFIRIVLFICVPAFLIFFSGSLRAAPVVIGSKKFTESYVLGEIAKRSLIDAGISVEHRQGMGGTIILWEALRTGQIDIYPEYTGTITQEILKRTDQLSFEQIASELGKVGIGVTEPLGFNNTYALPAPTITVLRKLEGTIDEAKMVRLNAEAERTKNYTRAAGLYFESATTSTRLRQGYGAASNAASTTWTAGENFSHKLARWTLRHLELAGFSLLLSVLVGIPLGIWASRGGATGHVILGFAGVVQTIPSLALLALLVPLPFFGISVRTAIAALFLYGLLPIVRNTATGLQDIPRALRA